jgi:endoglucanase
MRLLGTRLNPCTRWGKALVFLLATACVDQGRDRRASGGAGSIVSGVGGATGTGGTFNGSTMDSGLPSDDDCDPNAAVADMRLGWNLGNGLDSVSTQPDTTAETGWGNPMVTADLFKLVAASGFGVVRIPVTWIGRFGPAPDYTISPTFLGHVEQIVKYALDQDLYVIINLHHDGGDGVSGKWINLVDSSGQVTAANTDQVKTQFSTIWAQIANHFQTYGKYLIFESMNEVGVRNGPTQAEFDVLNSLNQAFVDTVRASGGNNVGRCLVVPGFYTNINNTVAGFQAPTDAYGKLILSAHYYDPAGFAMSGTTHAWGRGNPGIDNWGQEDWLQSQVTALKVNYIDRGLPVIWGEYGAVNQTGYESYRRYYMEYVTKATHDAGIVPIVWDNNNWRGSGNDAFGFINRNNNTVAYPTIVNAMVNAVTSTYTLADVAKP